MDESQMVISGASDHQSGFDIMCVLVRLRYEDISELIRPEADSRDSNPPSTKNTKSGEQAVPPNGP